MEKLQSNTFIEFTIRKEAAYVPISCYLKKDGIFAVFSVGKRKVFKQKMGIGTGDRELKKWEAEWN